MMQTSQRLRPQGALNDSAVIAAHCAHWLGKLRADAGETQKQLAKRIGMTESMISRLERGDHVPSLATLCRIADAFGRSLEIVFHEHVHEHGDGTHHSHPHGHHDADHQHDHGDEK
jgi:DNA-binding XRE family transcriptional regulator